MLPIVILMYAAVAALVAVESIPLETNDELEPLTCGYSKSRPRIVGGSAASPGEFPWTVSILQRGTHYCGGSIIGRRWIITAAHCVHRSDRSSLKVRTGEHKLSEKSEHEHDINVDRITVHPDFMLARYVNDVALLRVNQDMEWNDRVQPICLPEAYQESYVEEEVTVAGWGWTAEPSKGGTRSNVLQKLTMTVVEHEDCQKWYVDAGKRVTINVNHMCAGFKDGGKDSCHGDSGGPLMMKKGSQYQLVGVVSAGIGCARPLLPGLYTNVSAYLTWIHNTTEANP